MLAQEISNKALEALIRLRDMLKAREAVKHESK